MKGSIHGVSESGGKGEWCELKCFPEGELLEGNWGPEVARMD